MSTAVSPLEKLAGKALKLEVLAYAAGQVIRFVSSLILSRLLFPEAFGLAVTVTVINQGLQMVSDMGVSQSVVQSQRGDEPAFLNTAFTLMAGRGVLLWLLASLLSWPLSRALDQPDLASLIPVGALSVLFAGFSGTSLTSCRRQLKVKLLVLTELSAQVLSFVVTVALAWWLRSVWSLIIGGLCGSALICAVSHSVRIGERNRFAWDPSAWAEIHRYGKWIQASSALSFASNQGDRLLMAHFVGMAMLGTYNFALMLADAMSAVVIRITHGVFFPVFSQIHREDPARLPATFYKIRARLDLITLAPLGLVCAFSAPIVGLLFDPRYAEAAWMLKLLCLRSAMVCMLTPVETFLFSIGQTRFGFYRDLARSAWVLGGVLLAWPLAGMPGVVGVVALSELPVLVVLWTAFHRLGVLRLRNELLGALAFAVPALLGTAAWSLFSSSGR